MNQPYPLIIFLVSTLLAISACTTSQKKSSLSPAPKILKEAVAPTVKSATKLTPAATTSTPPSQKTKKTAKPKPPIKTTPTKPKTQKTPVRQATKKPTPSKTTQPITKKKPTVKSAAKQVSKPVITKVIQKPSKTIATTSQKSTPAPAPAPAKTPTSTIPVPTINVSLSTLPMQVGSWTLDLSQTENSQCLLTGTKNTMHDGQGDTPIYLEVSLKHITLHTKSNIDTSYADTGVFIGNQPIATIETLYTPTSVRFSSQYATLITSMKKHPTLEIELGFWPSWPVTHPYHASIVNESFESAYLALEKCNALL